MNRKNKDKNQKQKMKRLFLVGAICLTFVASKAAPTITMSGDTLVITVNGSGDLASSNFSAQQLKATNVKVVTANGYKLSTTDVTDFLGTAWTTPKFSMMTDLDLSLVDLQNNDDIKLLENSQNLNNGGILGTLVLPESLTSFPSGTFDNHDKWTKVVFPDANKEANKATTVIEAGTFTGNTYLQSLVIGTSVKSIGMNAFDGCTNLTEVEYLYGVEHVSSHAFWGCTGLKEVILPETVTEIGSGAFEGCSNLTTLRLPNSLKYIRSEAFDHTALSAVVIPAGVELIERGAFGNIAALTDVYVLGTTTKCKLQAFLPTQYTYQYTLQGTHNNGDVVNISEYSSERSGVYTILHYPEAAYGNYVNRFTQLIGTDEYASQSVYQSGNNKWVFDSEGNKWPVTGADYFSTSAGDYAGWNEFLFTKKLKGTYQDERLVDGKWYSVCFPFNLSQEQIYNAFGNATEVCEFSAVRIETDAESSKKYIVLEFKTPVHTMVAHHPYMIHPGLHGAAYNMIMDVTVDPDNAGDNYAGKLKAQAVTLSADGVNYTFVGNHTDGAKVPLYSYYYYSGNDTRWENGFYKAMHAGVTFTPQTAVVELDKDNGVAGAKQLYFMKEYKDLGGNETTGINTTPSVADTTAAAAAGNVYSIYGQIVRKGSASLAGLPAGVYIVKGRKVIVK